MNYAPVISGSVPCPSSFAPYEPEEIETAIDMAHTYLGSALELLAKYAQQPTRDEDETQERADRVNGLLREARLMLKGLEL